MFSPTYIITPYMTYMVLKNSCHNIKWCLFTPKHFNPLYDICDTKTLIQIVGSLVHNLHPEYVPINAWKISLAHIGSR